MRSRWTTGVYSCTDLQQNCGDTAGKKKPAHGMLVQAKEQVLRQIRALMQGRDADRNISREVFCRRCREKPLLFVNCPYRKPTQVDEERILRPTEEALLRNSAKCPRNFGRRGAYASRPQRKGSSNCLAKTQVYAKP